MSSFQPDNSFMMPSCVSFTRKFWNRFSMVKAWRPSSQLIPIDVLCVVLDSWYGSWYGSFRIIFLGSGRSVLGAANSGDLWLRSPPIVAFMNLTWLCKGRLAGQLWVPCFASSPFQKREGKFVLVPWATIFFQAISQNKKNSAYHILFFSWGLLSANWSLFCHSSKYFISIQNKIPQLIETYILHPKHLLPPPLTHSVNSDHLQNTLPLLDKAIPTEPSRPGTSYHHEAWRQQAEGTSHLQILLQIMNHPD